MLSNYLQRDASGYLSQTKITPINPTGGSALFNGTSQYFTVNASTDWSVGTGNFTIEWFQYMTSQPSNPRVFSLGNYSSATVACSIEGGTFYVWIGGSFVINFSLTSYLNTWIHFAIVRNGTSLVVYRNGTSVGSTTNSTNINNSSTVLAICQESSPTSGSYFPGNITNFRWTNSAVYTTSFPKPTSPLTALPQTKLLLLTSTSGTLLTDSSGTGKTVTNNGGATWNTRIPF